VLPVAKIKPSSSGFLSGIPHEVLIGLVVTVLLLVIQWPFRKFVWPWGRKKFDQWRKKRSAGQNAPEQLELALAFLTHLRDGVMPAVWRVHTTPAEVREHIRQNILEPIRGYVATGAGEHIKVVWFRPDEHRANLFMYEQVGHTPEGQAAMRLPIGGGIAGQAFTSGVTIYSPDCSKDARFRDLPHGHSEGSIVCVPIQRGGETTGVLSVWSTWKDAFWLAERLYFEALAAAIGSLEAFEEPL
jgi:GAF domain-containing protein